MTGVLGKIVGEARPERAERIRRGTEEYARNWRRYRAGPVARD